MLPSQLELHWASSPSESSPSAKCVWPERGACWNLANIRPRLIPNAFSQSYAGRMSQRSSTPRLHSAEGHTLVELVLVLALLGSCAAIGAVSLTTALGSAEGRGAAQSWQAATAWAQVGVMWHGGSVRLSYDQGHLQLAHDLALCGADLGLCAPVAVSNANVSRWVTDGDLNLHVSGRLASPDGGGSIYFDSPTGRYQVVVRPVTGLTLRRGLLVR